MAKMFTRQGLILIAAVAVAGLLLLRYAPAFEQFRNLHAARIHAKKITPILDADSRFREIKARVWTARGGCLMLRGTVANDEDEAALKKAVTATNPPVEVVFALDRPRNKSSD